MTLFLRRLTYFFVLFCVSLLLSQCVHLGGSGLFCSNTSMSLRDLEKLDETAKNNPDQSTRAKAHLQLAAYYSTYKNANYSAALKELEAYAVLDPEGAKKDNIQNWLVLLREFERTKNKLGKENKELKDSLERLKALDIKIEEKRKKVK